MTDKTFNRCLIGLAVCAGIFLMSDSRADERVEKAFTEGCLDAAARYFRPTQAVAYCQCQTEIYRQQGAFNAMVHLSVVRMGIQHPRGFTEPQLTTYISNVGDMADRVCARYTK